MDHLSRLSGISWFIILFSVAERNPDGTLLQDLRARTSERAIFRQRSRGSCDLCRKIARSDVRARKSCSNVPSGFLSATENKIINQEIPDRRERWSMAGQRIDRDKLRAAIRRMGSEYVFHMLDDAITLLPQTNLRKLIAQ